MLLDVSSNLSEVLGCQLSVVDIDLAFKDSSRCQSQSLSQDIQKRCFPRTAGSHNRKYFLRLGETLNIEENLLHFLLLLVHEWCLHLSLRLLGSWFLVS